MAFRDDPFFRRQHFGPMSGSPFDIHRHHGDHAVMRREQRDPMFGMMMMDPFARMQSMMANFDNMFAAAQEGRGGHSYSQSTVMHFSSTNGRDGQPQIYQASSSTRCAPGGIKESRKMERDSTTGVQKTSVSHQIGDKSRTVQREVNLRTNEREENREYINLTEEDEPSFSREWDEKARSYPRSLGVGPSRRDHYAHSMGLPSEPTHRQDRGMFVDHTHSSPPMYPRMQPYSVDNGQRKKRDKKAAKVTFD
ncbi:PREDICTED: myeloid leukemia factor-like [Amphimedon queenslandica]|uniref:Myeloid leukemia factor n=1 Tax=Amphimedon queenslandica TaxID=400682 RepID=A0A1X7VIC0_AMPQE|nr:PREDICTED: myeloid leukemia factor-like [Amphimedon queenslandica]|eukprot:XP_003384339.1 PREDICTED: myeloid leukemia factor-like [Amphimedon queenslandica]